MGEISGRVLPLFGLIMLGYVTARLTQLAVEGVEPLERRNSIILHGRIPVLDGRMGEHCIVRLRIEENPMLGAMAEFTLHPRLEADTVPVITLGLSRVLLTQDSQFPWLILVPEKPGLRDLHDLSPEDQTTAMHEIGSVSRVLQAIHFPDRMNVAVLGNMVPQLHIHIIARFTTDAAWPGPVWGVGEAEAYDEVALAETLETLRDALS